MLHFDCEYSVYMTSYGCVKDGVWREGRLAFRAPRGTPPSELRGIIDRRLTAKYCDNMARQLGEKRWSMEVTVRDVRVLRP
jgi:hypothetical protein